MKKIIKKIMILFSAVSGVSVVVFLFLDYVLGGYPYKLSENEAYRALEAVERTNTYEWVLLGDSVARQLFPYDCQGENETMYYLPTNQAITVVGNYVLLARYLENNPQTKRVVYMALPHSLANHIRVDFSYQYFVLPFYCQPYMDYIDEDTKNYICEKYGRSFSSNTFVRYFLRNSSLCLECYLDRLEEGEEECFPDMTVQYIGKMRDLCEAYDVEFLLYSPPLSDRSGFDENAFCEAAMCVEDTGLKELFEGYIASMVFYSHEFFGDEMHFTSEYLENNRKELLKNFPEIYDTICW